MVSSVIMMTVTMQKHAWRKLSSNSWHHWAKKGENNSVLFGARQNSFAHLFVPSSASCASLLERHMSTSPLGVVRFLLLMRTFHGNISAGRLISQRDVYYGAHLPYGDQQRQPPLFENQGECNREIQALCRALQVPRLSLGVYASARGFVVGALSIRDESGAWIDCSALGTQGKSITGDMDDLTREIRSNARYIVVIEKQGVYDELSGDRFYNVLPSILVTASGIPDIATRAFVSRLARDLALPVFGVADWNAGGVTVLSTYRYGSMGTLQEGSAHPVPTMNWLGLLWEDVALLDQRAPMSIADQARVNNLQVSSKLTNAGAAVRAQLDLMMHHAVKVELQALRAHGGSISTWLARKIMQRSFIAFE